MSARCRYRHAPLSRCGRRITSLVNDIDQVRHDTSLEGRPGATIGEGAKRDDRGRRRARGRHRAAAISPEGHHRKSVESMNKLVDTVTELLALRGRPTRHSGDDHRGGAAGTQRYEGLESAWRPVRTRHHEQGLVACRRTSKLIPTWPRWQTGTPKPWPTGAGEQQWRQPTLTGALTSGVPERVTAAIRELESAGVRSARCPAVPRGRCSTASRPSRRSCSAPSCAWSAATSRASAGLAAAHRGAGGRAPVDGAGRARSTSRSTSRPTTPQLAVRRAAPSLRRAEPKRDAAVRLVSYLLTPQAPLLCERAVDHPYLHRLASQLSTLR